MLKWIFKIITGYKKSNWLSRMFWRYYYTEQRRLQDKRPREDLYYYFDVSGGGKIAISKDPHFLCGDSAGFSVGVSWTMYPYCGGVIGRTEAKNMAEHILKQVAEAKETEENEIKNFYKGLCYNKDDYKEFTQPPLY